MLNPSDEQLRQRHVEDGKTRIDEYGSQNQGKKESGTMEEEHGGTWSSLGSDQRNVLVLIFLYVLQGIPLGLAGSMPMILQAHKADYATQAFFSFAFWPFSVKLLWAPIVDSLYVKSFGRRKSWLIPVQYMIALFLFVLSYHISSMLGDDGRPIDVTLLTLTFISLCCLCATQDIAVDGWALTMLKKENVGWASTCNTVGQTAGYFLGNVVFLALESAEFCNNYLRSHPQPTGLLTIEGFMYFWGWVFLISTTMTWFFKHERDELLDVKPEGIVDTYRMLWRIIKLPAVLKYCAILLSCKVAFAATDAVAGLKLVEAGLSKEKMALMGVPMVPLQILLPLVISKFTNGPRPLDVFVAAYPFRIVMGLVIAYVVWITPNFKLTDSTFPVSFYVLLVVVYAVHQVTVYSIYVAMMSFTAKISDPAVGGTYMTLLNTVANLGSNWPATLALYLVPYMNVTSHEQTTPLIDGFYVETVIGSVLGIIWLVYCKRSINGLNMLSDSCWKIR